MPRMAYVNGEYVPHNAASVHIEDRGYQFADGVYEVIGCIHGHFADMRGHLDRLERSLKELSIPMPVTRQSMQFIMRHLLRLNGFKSAAIYIQITRGVAPRDFKYPMQTNPSLVMTCRHFDFDAMTFDEKGVSVVTVLDQRWARRDIKTIALLPQTIAKQAAAEQGAFEAWMLDCEGCVTEGSSSNAWIYKDRTLITHPSGTQILKGVTRTAIIQVAKEEKIRIEERPFTPDEAKNAEEAFCSSATALLMPVVEIDGTQLADGKAGQLTKTIYERYRAYVRDCALEKQYQWMA